MHRPSLAATCCALLPLAFGCTAVETPAAPGGSTAVGLAAVEGEVSYFETEDGLLLCYARVGSGEEVLVVPGASWIAADAPGLELGRTVIYYDPRGRGRSDRSPAGSPPDLQRDLLDLELLRAHFGAESIHLLAWGRYAPLGAHYARSYPGRVESLALVAPIPARKSPHWRIYMRNFDDRLRRDAVEALETLSRGGIPDQEPEAWAEAYAQVMFAPWFQDPKRLETMRSRPFVPPNQDPLLARAQLEMFILSLGDWDWRLELAGVQCPTLVVHGLGDPLPLAASQEWADALPNAELVTLERCGHFPWVEQRAALFSALERL